MFGFRGTVFDSCVWFWGRVSSPDLAVFLQVLGVHSFFRRVCHPLQQRVKEMDISEQ